LELQRGLNWDLPASDSVHAATRRKILLVDDEADVVSTFQMILEMNGFEVEAYTSPISALSNFKPNEFGLLILDIRMPVMNGFELFKRIKNIESNVEACFITAYEDYREEFKESFPMLDEAKYFIRKPKAIEDLVNHVSTILG
jgi:two-component system, OmpR family, response regulator ChvI